MPLPSELLQRWEVRRDAGALRELGLTLDSLLKATGPGTLTNIPQSVADIPGAVPDTRTITAGAGLLGGGALLNNLTIDVGAGDGISVGVDSVAVDSSVVRTTRTITAGAGLTGGGDLSADRTIAVATAGITSAMLRDSAALSVLGRAVNSDGVPGDIAAGTDGHVLRRSGTTLGFGLVPMSSISLPTIGAPALDTLSEDFTARGSAGVADGTITYVTVGTTAVKISVAAGEGYIRTTNDQQGELFACSWPASVDIYTFSAPAAGQENVIFVGVEYSGGNVTAVTKAAFSDWNWYTNFPLARCSYDGTTLRILNAYAHSEDVSNLTRKWFRLTHPFIREEAPEGSGGLELSSSLRALAMTAGNIWHGFNRYTIAAAASGVAFDTHYRRAGGGFNSTFGVTAWPNTQYDDGSGTLATLTNNRYGALWVYLDVADGSLDVIYGAVNAVGVADAQLDVRPSTPEHLNYHGRLIGRIIFRKGAASATLVESAWGAEFSAATVADHNTLSGLQGGTASEYYHLTAAQSSALVTGSGTAGRIPQWATTATLGNSTLEKTGAGLLTLSAAGAYTLTVPATGTAALLAADNAFSGSNTFSGTVNTISPGGLRLGSTISQTPTQGGIIARGAGSLINHGFWSSYWNTYIAANAYHDGTDWKALISDTPYGYSSIICTDIGAAGAALVVLADGTQRTAGATRVYATVASVEFSGQLQLPITGSSAGLLLGGDALLYRSAADILRTPDSLTVDAGLNVGSATGATTGMIIASGDGRFQNALEVGINGSAAYIQGYNRSTPGYRNIEVWASTSLTALFDTSRNTTLYGGLNVGTATGAAAGAWRGKVATGEQIWMRPPGDFGAGYGPIIQAVDSAGSSSIQLVLAGSSVRILNELRLDISTAAGATAGGGATLPATVAGYLVIDVNGTSRKVPYYAT